LRENGSDKLFSWQSQPNHLMYRLSSHHRTRQSCKKSARIKLLVDNTYGDKTCRSLKQIASSKLFKTKKMTKMAKRTADVMVSIAAEI
jgi:hypothetical protein